MGKISRNRKKYHTPGQSTNNASSEPPQVNDQDAWNIGLPLNFTLPTDLFSGVNITGEDLNQQLDVRSVADDTRSLVSKKSFKSDRPYKKKEKRQLRHEAFMMKLNAAKDAELEAKARRKRQKTVVVGDMQPLADALPQLTAPIVKTQPVKERSTPKIKTRQQMICIGNNPADGTFSKLVTTSLEPFRCDKDELCIAHNMCVTLNMLADIAWMTEAIKKQESSKPS